MSSPRGARGGDRLDQGLESASRASASTDAESLDTLRFIVLQLISGFGLVGFAAVTLFGDLPVDGLRWVFAVTALGCGVTLIVVRRAGAAGTRFGLAFLSVVMAVSAVVALTIQPAPLGTLTGFVFLALAVCVAATEPAPVGIAFGGAAVALGLIAITTRSIVPVEATAIFVPVTALAVFVVIRFRMIVSKARDQAVADSLTDPLTGLGNRRRMDLSVTLLGQIADRSGQRVGCLVIDIDHFKTINDKHGHDAGDQILRTTASIITDTVRKGDLVVRLGGDEFAVFTIAAASDSLSAMGERIREAVESADSRPPASVSIGGTVASALSTDELAELVGRSDRALYAAKQSGRNAVVIQ